MYLRIACQLSSLMSLFLFLIPLSMVLSFFFFFNDTATTEIYTLSLHDALPICSWASTDSISSPGKSASSVSKRMIRRVRPDRKSTRLNSSHLVISYAVFCLKKKKQNGERHRQLQPSSLYAQRTETDPHASALRC